MLRHVRVGLSCGMLELDFQWATKATKPMICTPQQWQCQGPYQPECN